NCLTRAPERLSETLAWGLGWGIERTARTARSARRYEDAIWHWGDNGAFKCFVMASPNRRLGVVMFTNSASGLSILAPVLAQTIGGAHPAVAWIKYEPYDSVTMKLRRAIVSEGAEPVIARSRSTPAFAVLKEGALNDLGYDLLSMFRREDAIEVFK